MIAKDELKNFAKIRKLNLGQAEKDYFQYILLFILYEKYGSELVFKGGTALQKCYGLNRFSGDLDFTVSKKIKIEKIKEIIEKDLKRFLIDFETETKSYRDGLKIILRIKGPLFIGARASLCRFELDISFRENIILKPNLKTIGRFLEEIPSFDIFVMQEKEILAEKVRAIIKRNLARDIYDLWFLLKKGTKIDIRLIKEKLRYYNEKWNYREFNKKINEKKDSWETELKYLVVNLPQFNIVAKEIRKKFKNLK